MIVVDANVFLRFVVESMTTADIANSEVAATLFRLAEDGLVEFTSNAAVIAEVVFILSSDRHYDLSRTEAVHRIQPLIELSACKIPDKVQLIRSLVRWQDSAKLSFVDALVIEQSLAESTALATFDQQIRKSSGIKLWQVAK